MKECLDCNTDIYHQSAKRCSECRKIYLKKYGKEYRDKNRKECQKRSKLSYLKKEEHYINKRRENYRRKRGIPLDHPFRKRKAGEGNIDSHGYKTITVRGHPNAMDGRGRIREHVYVMSNFLGRPLRKGETVHHKNGQRADNRVENLELWDRSQPAGQKIDDKIKWAIEFLLGHGYKVIKE